MPELQTNIAPHNQQPGKNRGWVVVLVLALGAAGIFTWVEQRSGNESAGASAESTLTLETFVVNVGSTNGSGQRAFLRVGITLGLRHPLPRNQPEATPTALVRDTILSVLAAAQPEELLKAEGKRQLKDDLLKALQTHAPQLGIENVYFTEFLVQM